MNGLTLALSLLVISFAAEGIAKESICFGTTSKGKLENGVELPSSGPNFESYSTIARLVGRTYVHSTVKSIMVSSYKTLETEQPDKVYKYAETGFEQGGTVQTP